MVKVVHLGSAADHAPRHSAGLCNSFPQLWEIATDDNSGPFMP